MKSDTRQWRSRQQTTNARQRGGIVIPAKTGTQRWVCAFAGMTEALAYIVDPPATRRHFAISSSKAWPHRL